MPYQVALCGLTVRDERLIEIVLSRAPNPKYPFATSRASGASNADIAIADASTLQAVSMVAELKALNPQLSVVFVSDLGMTGDSPYRIERRSLLLKINRVLDEVVENELLNQAQVRRRAVIAATSGTSAASAASFQKANAASKAEVPLQPLRALIVDDSLTVREQLRTALENVGLLSDQADSAESAQRLLSANSYDLVFLDVVMPGADGYEVCRSIKKNAYTRSVPVLMLTSRSSPFDRARGALAGCNSYLVKPITWEAFFEAIDRVLNKQFKNDSAQLSARGYRAASAG